MLYRFNPINKIIVFPKYAIQIQDHLLLINDDLPADAIAAKLNTTFDGIDDLSSHLLKILLPNDVVYEIILGDKHIGYIYGTQKEQIMKLLNENHQT